LDLLVLLLVVWLGRSFSPFFKRRKTGDAVCATGRMAGLSLFELLAR
jgi:hypothetical protein